MQALRFYKLSPGGNVTILVLDRVEPARRAEVARALMSEGHLGAEQVGFLNLEAHPVRLDMMGGEFCGNACRAAAAVMAMEDAGLVRDNRNYTGQLSVSGVEHLLDISVGNRENGYECQVEMPDAREAVRWLEPGMAMVRLPGISHICLDESRHAFPKDYASAARVLRSRFGLDHDDASGCIWYAASADETSIQPVVWVRATGTTYYETGCGSGSLAVALALSNGKKLPMREHIRQPSGEHISVLLDEPNGSLKAHIYGLVTVIARGEVFV